MCILNEAHPHSSEDESEWNKHPHREWRCDSPGMHILTWNGDVSHRDWGCASSGTCCDSLGMHILTGNAYPHRECT